MATIYSIYNNPIGDTVARTEIAEIQAYIGYNNTDIIGLQVDYENSTFKRLAGAVGKTAGADFNVFPMYGGMKRCNLADDGTVNAYYGDTGYIEDGSNGQVMVEIPKFYYKAVPLKLEKIQPDGNMTHPMGYHLLKANYYLSAEPREGFKAHPLFVKNGTELDKAYISAYEGCIYDASAGAYLAEDEQVGDFTTGTGDKLSSIAGVKPVSGVSQQLTRANSRILSHNRGTGWEQQTIKMVSAVNMLFMVEYGNLDWQNSISKGICVITTVSDTNCSSYTGSTSSLGNSSGRASSTKSWNGVVSTESNKTSVSYRGIENFFGNIYKITDGMNIWGDGTMGGGQPFICTDDNYEDNKSNGNYTGSGFTLPNENGYIKYFGYSTDYDWLFMPSKVGGSSSVPVGDSFYGVTDLNGYRNPIFGGQWSANLNAGGFYWHTANAAGYHTSTLGARLCYVG